MNSNFFNKLFSIISLLFLSDALYFIFGNDEEISGKYSIYIIMAIFLVTLIILLINNDFSFFKENKIMWLLMIFIGLSFLWSDYPRIALEKAIGLIGTTLFGLFLFIKFKFEEFVKIVIVTMSIIIITSIVMVFLNPEIGVHHDMHHAGAWRGVFSHKNMLGRIMNVSLIFTLCYISTKIKKKWLLFSVIVSILSIFMIIMSGSTTALLLIFLIIVLLNGKYFYRLNPNLLIFLVSFFFISLVVATILYSNYSYQIMSYLGRDPTLTGRTLLWEELIKFIKERPFIGYGYQSFWLGYNGTQSNYIWNKFGYEFAHGHNGYLDLLIQLGICGTLIFLITLIYNLINSIKLVRNSNENLYIIPFIFLTFLMVLNMSETVFLKQNSIYWVVYIYLSFFLTRNVKQYKKER